MKLDTVYLQPLSLVARLLLEWAATGMVWV